jgi:hypothetical protein
VAHSSRRAPNTYRHVAPFAACCLLAGSALAYAAPQDAAALLAVPPRTWAVDTAANEILVVQHPGSYLRYRMHVVDEKGDQIRDQIETLDGSVARLILRDGRPLTPDEDAAERSRLTDLLASPSAFHRHIDTEQTNKKRGVDILKLMPDAMLWTYAPNQPQTRVPPPAPGTPPAAPQIVLDFTPDPAWSPPTMTSEALTGLRGRIWIDSQTHRMVRLEGDLFRAINMGWGVLAHVYPGGTILLQQTNAGGQRWIVDHIDERLSVRALMVKTVKQRLVFDTGDYQTIGPLSYRDAIKLLLDSPLPTH